MHETLEELKNHIWLFLNFYYCRVKMVICIYNILYNTNLIWLELYSLDFVTVFALAISSVKHEYKKYTVINRYNQSIFSSYQVYVYN